MSMPEFDRVCCTDPTVYSMTRANASQEDIIVALANEKIQLQLALAKAMAGTSRVLVLEDGREVVVHPTIEQMERYDMRKLHQHLSTEEPK